MPEHRSVSQYTSYRACPYRYYLERVARPRPWRRPAAWLFQGTAVHQAAEAWERSGRTLPLPEVEDVFRASYEQLVNEACADTANLTCWFSSGPYDGASDLERRCRIGVEQVQRYVTYYTEIAPAEVVWTTPDGDAAIELELRVEFGEVQVLLYIDQVIAHPAYGLMPRDIKTGRLPGDAFQIATYARSLERAFDVQVRRGDYWMGRNGKPTVPYDLSSWPAQRLDDEFGWLDTQVKAEKFEPTPEPATCRFCSVASACPFAI